MIACTSRRSTSLVLSLTVLRLITLALLATLTETPPAESSAPAFAPTESNAPACAALVCAPLAMAAASASSLSCLLWLRSRSFSFSSISPRMNLFIDDMRVSSFMPKRCEQSCRYVSRMIWSGMTDMLLTMLDMASERLMGSLTPSSIMAVLNCMKSVCFSSINCLNSSDECFLAKLSGSSPSGKSNTLIFMPSDSSMSVPLMAACMPASSPS